MSRYEQKISRKNSRVWVITVVIILTVLAVWLYQQNEQVADKETKAIAIPVDKSVPDIAKKGVPVNAETAMPGSGKSKTNESVEEGTGAVKPTKVTLEASDDSFRKAVGNVSVSLLNWFQVKDVIRKYIVIINDLSQNQILYKHRKFLKMPQKFVAKEDSQGLYIATFRPLFKQVFDEFAYPAEYRVEDIFMKAASSVLQAPVIKGRIYLRRHSVRYKFAKEELEALNGVEKQMIRMGPENTEKIQAKLRQLVEAISALN
jgi:sRNA-binding regulator protein Hfq